MPPIVSTPLDEFISPFGRLIELGSSNSSVTVYSFVNISPTYPLLFDVALILYTIDSSFILPLLFLSIVCLFAVFEILSQLKDDFAVIVKSLIMHFSSATLSVIILSFESNISVFIITFSPSLVTPFLNII